jgi:transcriptional regulator with XRE-family HTH domain
MTQEELAAASGVGRVTIARLETGQSEARPSTTRALAKALGVKASVLMSDGEGAFYANAD